MDYYYSPLDRGCKSRTGAIAQNSILTLHVYCKEGGGSYFSARSCVLILFRDGEEARRIPMHPVADGFALSLRFHETGLWFYRFLLDEVSFGRGTRRCGTLGSEENWQITVFEEGFQTPGWFKGGVMYQIFPDRFCRGSGEYPIAEGKLLREDWGGTPDFRPDENGKVLNRDFFGGNFNGVREKLPYLKELGVSVIYFNPVFEAFSNHRYDTGDYLKLDQLLGTEEDFDRLVAEAKACGIRIVLDGVFNHTGDDSRYFNKFGKYDSLGAYQSPASQYADWYRFQSFPQTYDCWWGIVTLPAVNESSESYQRFVCGKDGVLRHWLRHGISGYRIDVADELPDFFLQMLRKAVKSEDPDAVIIGEVWEDASNKISYDERRTYLQGSELDSVMNYPLKDGILNYMLSGRTDMLLDTIDMLRDNYPKEVLDSLMNILGTHDTPRVLTVLGSQYTTDKEEMARISLSDESRSEAKQRLKMAAVLQFTFFGVPCVYYGDEAGSEGFQDPFCRRCFPWDKIDEDLHGFYKTLGSVRSANKDIFRDGEYREIYSDYGCLVFERRSEAGVICVYANRSVCTHRIEIEGIWDDLLNGGHHTEHVKIEGNSYGILRKKSILCQT